MNRLISLCTVLLLSSFTCTVLLPADTISIGDAERTFVLHAPEELSNPPLVINMHGLTGTGSQQRAYTRMDRIADREKFIVVYPDGLDKTWDISGNQDVDFISALIDTLYASHAIDRNRVYATGFSMGGFMSHHLGCAVSDKIAAIAPVAGLSIGGRNCTVTRPVPVLQIHGTADPIVQYSGVAATINGWVTRNGCPSTPEVMKPYPATNEASVVTRDYYGPGDQGSEVILLSLEGVGHAWPSNTTTQINASEEIWAFFKGHSLNDSTATVSAPARAQRKRARAFWSDGIVRLSGIQDIRSVRVLDTQGRVMATIPGSCDHFALQCGMHSLFVLIVSAKDGVQTVRMVVP